MSEPVRSSVYMEVQTAEVQKPAPQDSWATPDDIREAIEALAPEDYLRILKAAKVALGGTEFKDPQELINEVVVRSMIGASGGKGRHWPKNVPFVAYMIQTISGLADDSRCGLPQKRTVSLKTAGEDRELIDRLLDERGINQPDPLQLMVDEEAEKVQEQSAREEVEKIEALFADNDNAMMVIMGFKDGLSPEGIREVSGMNLTQYNTTRRLIRRRLEKLYPGRRAS